MTTRNTSMHAPIMFFDPIDTEATCQVESLVDYFLQQNSWRLWAPYNQIQTGKEFDEINFYHDGSADSDKKALARQLTALGVFKLLIDKEGPLNLLVDKEKLTSKNIERRLRGNMNDYTSRSDFGAWSRFAYFWPVHTDDFLHGPLPKKENFSFFEVCKKHEFRIEGVIHSNEKDIRRLWTSDCIW